MEMSKLLLIVTVALAIIKVQKKFVEDMARWSMMRSINRHRPGRERDRCDSRGRREALSAGARHVWCERVGPMITASGDHVL